MTADAYYALNNQLVSLFSQTNFNRYVAKRAGHQVTRQELLEQFGNEFGQENSNFLSLRCSKVDGTSLLTEIQLVLKKDLTELNDFTNLFPADEVRPQGNCPQEFKIDSVGLGNF
jgi:ribonuclease I